MPDAPGFRTIRLGPTNGLVFGHAGWALYYEDDHGDGPDTDFDCWVRIEDPDGSRLIITEVVTQAGRVTSRTFDRIPLGRIEEAVNAPGIAAHVRANQPPFRSARESAVEFVNGSYFIGRPPGGPWDVGRDPDQEPLPLPKVITGTGRRPDTFYAEVATAYSYYASKGSRPVSDLADANGLPTSTVHRWVKEARRRGLLVPSARATGPKLRDQVPPTEEEQ